MLSARHLDPKVLAVGYMLLIEQDLPCVCLLLGGVVHGWWLTVIVFDLLLEVQIQI